MQRFLRLIDAMGIVFLVGSHERAFLNFRATLIQRLASDGHQVHAVVWGKQDAQSERLQSMMHHVTGKAHWLGSTGASFDPIGDPIALWRLLRLIQTHQPSSALLFASKPIGLGALCFRIAKCPISCLMEGRGTGFLNNNLIAHANTFLFRLAFKSARSVVVLNHEDQAWVQDQMGVTASKIQRLDGIGVPLDRFHSAAGVQPEQPPQLCYLGRLARSKGLLVLLQAFAGYKAQGGQAQLLIYGAPADNPKDALGQDDISSHPNDGVRVMGEIGPEDVPDVLAKASCVVHPAIAPEGLPSVIMEAFASATPVIATAVRGSIDALGTDQLGDCPAGILVKPNDVAQMQAALTHLLDTPQMLAQLGHQARLIAERRFDRNQADQALAAFIAPADTTAYSVPG